MNEPRIAPVWEVANNDAGRDFVVGDVHGEFKTLTYLLSMVEFDAGNDRLFAVGDLIDRGPRSTDALKWMESGRIAVCVRGNHEQMLLRRIEVVESNPGALESWAMHPWFEQEIDRRDWARWKDMIRAMPIAATVHTPAGPVGLVHATPTARNWETTLAQLRAGDSHTHGSRCTV